MNKQVYKVKNIKTGAEVFFTDEAFTSAFTKANRYIERNKGKGDYELYYRNQSPFGSTWLLIKRS